MNPRTATGEPEPAASAAADRFRYGWRYVKPGQANGDEEDRIPLTLEDVLHPQEGDVIPEKPTHESDRRYLSDVLKQRTAGKGLVLSDCLIDWNVEGIRNHSPDITFFPGVTRPPGDWGIYHVAWDGARASLVIELTSPDTRETDLVRKYEHYHQVGVQEYVIVDREARDSPTVIGYQYTLDGYVRIPLDERGRILLEPVGLVLGFENGRVVCFDAASGEEVGDYLQVCEALEAETAARQAAEQAAREQAEARQAAEQAAQRQAEARQAAEQLVQEQAAARQAAEQQAQDLAQRLRVLEEELRHLRGEPREQS
jgi:Uma2 family endonuclease